MCVGVDDPNRVEDKAYNWESNGVTLDEKRVIFEAYF